MPANPERGVAAGTLAVGRAAGSRSPSSPSSSRFPLVRGAKSPKSAAGRTNINNGMIMNQIVCEKPISYWPTGANDWPAVYPRVRASPLSHRSAAPSSLPLPLLPLPLSLFFSPARALSLRRGVVFHVALSFAPTRLPPPPLAATAAAAAAASRTTRAFFLPSPFFFLFFLLFFPFFLFYPPPPRPLPHLAFPLSPLFLDSDTSAIGQHT